MGLVKKIATSVEKSAAKVVAKKAIKNISKTVESTAENLILKNANSEKNLPQKFETKSESVGIVTKTKNFLKQAGKEFSTSDFVDIAGMATGTSAVLGLTTFAGKTALDVKATSDILTEKVEQLRAEGKITQDILDAILCENKNKLALAYREAMRAEAMGQPLKYLSEDEAEAALGFRKQITKAVTHKVVGKN